MPDKTQFLDSPSSGEGGSLLVVSRVSIPRTGPCCGGLQNTPSLQSTHSHFEQTGAPPPHEGPFASGIGLTASPLFSHQQLAARDKEQNKKRRGSEDRTHSKTPKTSNSTAS